MMTIVPIFLSGLCLGIFLYFIISNNLINKNAISDISKMIRDSIIEATYEKEILTIKYESGKILQYEGSCTVWHTYPMMRRCDTFKEGELCDIWAYIKKHGNSYPNAHKKLNRPQEERQEERSNHHYDHNDYHG